MIRIDKVEGLDALMKAFEKLGDEAIKDVEEASITSAGVIKSRAVTLAPGPTGRSSGKWAHAPGNLKNKIKATSPRKSRKNKLKITASVSFGTGAAYGVPVELGHKVLRNGKVVGEAAEKPFLRPAADENRGTVEKNVIDAINRALDDWGD
jgi:hypothetical protein